MDEGAITLGGTAKVHRFQVCPVHENLWMRIPRA
jgi:hypothetical protein